MLLTRMDQDKEIITINKAAIKEVLSQSKDELDEPLARELGIELGADFAILGSLTKIGSGASLDAIIIDTQGEKDNIHISIVAQRVILVVIFDHRSSLGLVRLRVKKASDELATIFEDLSEKATEMEKTGNVDSPFAEITDDDIDNLFS